MLTWNEEQNVERCLASLAAQRSRAFDVIVIDAASSDRTVAIVRSSMAGFPVPIRLEAVPYRIPIGAARNLGASLATTSNVAFLSADAEAGPDWVERALVGLRTADMVFGRQLHRPHQWNVGSAVRGMRYHFPDHEVLDATPYASNVAAAYRKEILMRWPFEPGSDAAEDLLLARRATAAGAIARYDPTLVVQHHDVAGWRGEFVKSVREGFACGGSVKELGLRSSLLAWGAVIVAFAVMLALVPGVASISLFVLAVWAPALRRLVRRRRAMAPGHLALGLLASPLFDLIFLFHYLRGLLGRPLVPRSAPKTQEYRP